VISRRNLLKAGAMAGGSLVLLPRLGIQAARASAGGKLAKYVQPLPVPGNGIAVATPSGLNAYSFTQTEIKRQLHPDLPKTPVWAYDDGSGLAGQFGSFGMAVVAQSGTPITVSYRHELPDTYPSRIPVDTRLTPLGNEVRLMTHLHGGFVAGESDGSPAVTPDGFGQHDTQTVYYTNQLPQMPASLLWFHDHGLGATRLNVFAGLAAAYILRDQFDTGHEGNQIGIPGDAYEVPLVIQDRQFNRDGTFLYPTSDIAGATWIGEYFGDVMLVNGKVWPFLEVEPRMYRFRVLNGCNARILSLDVGAAKLWQIGAEGGMWDKPVQVGRMVLTPAERADILVDFSKFAGQTLVLKNHKPPAPISTPAPSLEPVMQIRVGTTVTHPGPSTIPVSLPGRKADLRNPLGTTRYLTLNEIDPDEPTWFLNINGLHFDAPVQETPTVGAVEDWVYINLTADTHPIHTHLVTFQVIGRTPFDAEGYEEAFEPPTGGGVPGGIDPSPFATGPMVSAGPDERGFKDTVKANPGEFTTIRAKFELPTNVPSPQKYVYHCHIVEHEDNDMMRPFTVTS
jgi:spore coat protein A, manganese oxidase